MCFQPKIDFSRENERKAETDQKQNKDFSSTEIFCWGALTRQKIVGEFHKIVIEKWKFPLFMEIMESFEVVVGDSTLR